jgi:SAM-dependent methyltransferase
VRCGSVAIASGDRAIEGSNGKARLRWKCPRCAAEPTAEEDRVRCTACGGGIERREGIWRVGDGFRPQRFSAARREHLAALEIDHFWFPARRRLLAALLARCAPRPGGAVIELGCGSGTALPLLAAEYPICVGVEGHPESLDAARDRATGALLIEGDATRVPLADGCFDLAVGLDVLEHVEPEALLGEARRLLRPGASLIVSVPAFPSLWSALDERAGHRCRYRRRALEAELAANGFRVVHWTHYQALLFPLAWLARRFASDGPVPLERRPPRLLGRALGIVNALEVALFARARLPFGTSLFVIARRGDGSAQGWSGAAHPVQGIS